MKKFLIKVSIGTVILFALACALDYSISKGLLQMEDYRFMSWNDMLNGDASSELVVLGNSRGFSHYEPQTIDSICGLSTYVLGIGGYPINVELLKYACYREHNKKPKYIIYDVNYIMMKILKAPHQHESEQFLPLVYDSQMRRWLHKVGYSYFEIYCPLYRYFGYQMVIKNGLLEFFGLKHYISKPSYRGHHYEEGDWNGTEVNKMDTIDGSMNPDAIKMFEEFLSKCTSDSIKVFLVNSPIYYKTVAKTTKWDEANQYFDSLATKYHYTYLKYTENYELCKDTANFVVSVHMNPHATHQFSIDLANKINEILLTNQ